MSEHVRRFVAVVQDPKGYPPAGVTVDETIAAPVMLSVVREDDYNALCQVAQDLYETLNVLVPDHSECYCEDDLTCAGCRARAVVKAYAGADW